MRHDDTCHEQGSAPALNLGCRNSHSCSGDICFPPLRQQDQKTPGEESLPVPWQPQACPGNSCPVFHVKWAKAWGAAQDAARICREATAHNFPTFPSSQMKSSWSFPAHRYPQMGSQCVLSFFKCLTRVPGDGMGEDRCRSLSRGQSRKMAKTTGPLEVYLREQEFSRVKGTRHQLDLSRQHENSALPSVTTQGSPTCHSFQNLSLWTHNQPLSAG